MAKQPKFSLNSDRFFDPNPGVRTIARKLYSTVKNLPIISPHGHVDPSIFVDNKRFPNPTDLFIIPDHYVFRMLHSQGIPLDTLGIPHRDGSRSTQDAKKVWQLFGDHYYLFRGTPSGVWLNYEFSVVFGIKEPLNGKTALRIYSQIDEKLQSKEFYPRALFDRFNIEVLTTTDAAFDPLSHHKKIRESGWKGNIVPCFRPDSVTDLSNPDWKNNILKLGVVDGTEIGSYRQYIEVLERRRRYFKSMGAVSTDHGVYSAYTHRLSDTAADETFKRALKGKATKEDAVAFTGHMLMEMARMSIEDGLVMQIHAGCYRNHDDEMFRIYGPDKGGDIPVATEYVHNMKPLLNAYGNDPRLTVIVFTLDETTYARELAPLAGYYSAMKLGPAWWFHDSIEGMLRYRSMVTESGGIYNTVGFNDDTRAFVSIPARHDLSRRIDSTYLASLVARHIIDMDAALELIYAMANGLVRQGYKLTKKP
jgi:glucuronate isomerase